MTATILTLEDCRLKASSAGVEVRVLKCFMNSRLRWILSYECKFEIKCKKSLKQVMTSKTTFYNLSENAFTGAPFLEGTGNVQYKSSRNADELTDTNTFFKIYFSSCSTDCPPLSLLAVLQYLCGSPSVCVCLRGLLSVCSSAHVSISLSLAASISPCSRLPVFIAICLCLWYVCQR